MFHAAPQGEQHILLALDHHRQLLDEAKRYRESHGSRLERSLRWRRLRQRVGDLLIYMGEQLQAGIAEKTPEPVAKRVTQGIAKAPSKAVWG